MSVAGQIQYLTTFPALEQNGPIGSHDAEITAHAILNEEGRDPLELHRLPRPEGGVDDLRSPGKIGQTGLNQERLRLVARAQLERGSLWHQRIGRSRGQVCRRNRLGARHRSQTEGFPKRCQGLSEGRCNSLKTRCQGISKHLDRPDIERW